jgi:hypothetical protein
MTGTVPPVPVFPAGYAPQPADFDAWIQQPFLFCTSKVMFRAQLATAQAFGAGTYTLLHFGTTYGDILEDPYSGWSTAATTTQAAYSWLCPPGCSGWYEVQATAFTTNPGTATDQVATGVYLDGSLYAQSSSTWGVNGHATGSCGGVMVYLTSGVDYVQTAVYSTASTSGPATAGQYPTTELAWISS